ncbi:UDP-glucose 4-epimerase [Sporolactobacillus inulinus]|uniref:UDP-glucose 4-epimerase n=1 Tax=Sporolactobacillus inulinus TaxID=2078 RepID=A0A4Y1ZG41_9BACL|nr:UDP-glucose 4-epimerase [Sporolactobacillus inulinus]
MSQSVADPLFDERTNVTGSLNIMNGARLQCEKIVFASSAAVYGNPLEIPITTEHPTRPESPYGLTKRTVENYLHLFANFMICTRASYASVMYTDRVRMRMVKGVWSRSFLIGSKKERRR